MVNLMVLIGLLLVLKHLFSNGVLLLIVHEYKIRVNLSVTILLLILGPHLFLVLFELCKVLALPHTS